MKKILSFIMCAAMLTGSLTCVHADEALTDSAVNIQDDPSVIAESATDVAIPVYELMPSTKVLVIGDSNACGYGLTNGTTESGLAVGSFADVFASEILKNNQTAEMFAAPGATLQSLVNIIEDPEQSVVLANALNQVDIVDINLGGNDLLNMLKAINASQSIVVGGDGATVAPLDLAALAISFGEASKAALDLFAANFEKVMSFISNIDDDPYVAVNAVPTPDTTKLTQNLSDDVKAIFSSLLTSENVAAVVDSANKILQGANVPYKSTFVDFSGLQLTTQADGIHFDENAHAVIGGQVTIAINKVIKENRVKSLLIGLQPQMLDPQ